MSNTPDNPITITYFSVEISLDAAMPTCSAGLGVLAGDILRAAADSGAPMVGVMPLHSKGYFRQPMHAQGNQSKGLWHRKSEASLQALQPRVVVRKPL